MKTILIILLLPFHVLAQDLTGIWAGTIRTAGNDLPFELVISDDNGKLSGYTLMIFTMKGGENIGIKSVRIKNKNGNVSLEDGELIYNNYSSPPKRVKLFGELSLFKRDSVAGLSGKFKTKSMDFRSQDNNDFSGTIELERKNISAQTRLIRMLGQLNLLNTLSFLRVKTGDKELTAQADIPAEEDEVFSAKRKEIFPERVIIRESAAVQSAELIRSVQIISIYQSIEKENLDTHFLAGNPPLAPDEKENEKVPGRAKGLPHISESQPLNITAANSFLSPIIKTETSQADKIIAASEERKTEIVRSVFFKTDSLVLSLYDNGTVDGDSVSVVMNGKVIIANQGLTTKPIRVVIHITPEMGDSLLVTMIAENLGTIPPNTGLLVVEDGEDRNEIFFTGDMQMSSAVLFRRKR
jgi:hypothetical protein